MLKTLGIILCSLIILFVLASCAGMYFVNYALKRQTFDPDKTSLGKTGGQKGDEVYLPGNEDNPDAQPYITISKQGQEWADSVPSERWETVSDDGLRLVAKFFPVQDSHKYVILAHGYTSQKEAMYGYGFYFAQWGYNVLAVDHRSHGESEGKYIGMGWLESRDCLKWISMIVDRDPDAAITMLGVSMGGATVMMTSGLDLPANVKCLVEDCGYSSVWTEFSNEFKAVFKLPTWPLMNIADRAAKRIAGYSLKEASSTDRLANAKVPMLFIHGTADTFVSYSMLDENIAAIGDTPHEVLRVEGAGHGMSLYKDEDLYISTLKAFLDKYIMS